MRPVDFVHYRHSHWHLCLLLITGIVVWWLMTPARPEYNLNQFRFDELTMNDQPIPESPALLILGKPNLLKGKMSTTDQVFRPANSEGENYLGFIAEALMSPRTATEIAITATEDGQIDPVFYLQLSQHGTNGWNVVDVTVGKVAVITSADQASIQFVATLPIPKLAGEYSLDLALLTPKEPPSADNRGVIPLTQTIIWQQPVQFVAE